MDLVEVDEVGTESSQALFARSDPVVPREAALVRSRPAREAGLGGQQHPVAPAIALPRSPSDLPEEYASAVSNRLTPALRYMSTCRVAAA
jgi:hypothetical protein